MAIRKRKTKEEVAQAPVETTEKVVETPVETPKTLEVFDGQQVTSVEDVEVNGTPVKKLTLGNGTTTIVPLETYNSLIN